MPNPRIQYRAEHHISKSGATVVLACPDRFDLYYYNLDLDRFVEAAASGSLISDESLQEAEKAGCVALLDGSQGRVARDESGELVVHVDVAEYGGDEFDLELGWYYVVLGALWEDVATPWSEPDKG